MIFLACALYLWLLGAAAFGRWKAWRSPFRAPWLGYAVLVACLQIAHLFTPIDSAFSWKFLALSSIGAAGILAFRFRTIVFRMRRTQQIVLSLYVAAFLSVAWLAFGPAFNLSTQPIVHYDVGYYYLETIRWLISFPIVPGLGNLLLNLAFNQSPFLIASFFDSLGVHLWGYFLLGAIMPWLGLTLSGFALLQGLFSLLAIRRRITPREKAYAISLPAWIYTLLSNNISSNSPDIPSACLQIHLFLCFASFLARKDTKALITEFSELVVLGALSLTIKLNSVFFVTAILLLAAIVVWRRIGRQLLTSKQMQYVLLATAILFLPWLARGIILSGYPLFPLTILGAPVPWRIPPSEVSHFYDITVYWARQPFYDLAKVQSGFAWVPEWLERIRVMKDQFTRPMILSILWTLLLIAFAWKSGTLRRVSSRFLLLFAPVVFSLLMWFLSAPEPRYLGSITWLLPLVAPLVVISETVHGAIVFMALTFLLDYIVLGNLRYNTEWAWKRRAPSFPEIRKVEILEATNQYGVSLHYPKRGDQTFDAELPSTRSLHPFLLLLNETKGLAGGFRDARVDDHGKQRQHHTD
ncbi:MAG TPA: hypothetical protein VIS99_14095 [Terrimicrobiaceae bacterium]